MRGDYLVLLEFWKWKCRLRVSLKRCHLIGKLEVVIVEVVIKSIIPGLMKRAMKAQNDINLLHKFCCFYNVLHLLENYIAL